MRSRISQEKLEQLVAFHGHLCPGLTSGIRVAEIALREFGPRAEDEEIVAVVETDSCAVDAVQFLVGCTFGKGNLMHLDHGKHVFTFARRSDGKAIRISGKPRERRAMTPEQEALAERVRSGAASPEDRAAYAALWRQRALAVLDEEEDDLLDVETLEGYPIPDRASIHLSVRCEACGEMVMATRIHRWRGKQLCIPCFERATANALTMRPVGVVHNDLVPHDAPPRARSAESVIEIYPEYEQALTGIAERDRLQILFWFDRARDDVPFLQHPMGDTARPLTGVFALCSPHRPNPIGLTTVRLLRVEGRCLVVADLDAWDGTPVLDIKPYIAPAES